MVFTMEKLWQQALSRKIGNLGERQQDQDGLEDHAYSCAFVIAITVIQFFSIFHLFPD